jgi:transposase-like protein
MPPKKHLVQPGLGRPSKLTPELQEQIVKDVKQGNFIEIAAERAGVHRTTVFRWLREAEEGHPDPNRQKFRFAIIEARAEAEATMVALVRRAAMGGVVIRETTRVHPDGTEEHDVAYSAPDGRIGLEYLSRAFPDRWRKQTLTYNQTDMQVSGPDGGPIQIQTTRFTELAGRLTANQPKVIEGETG